MIIVGLAVQLGGKFELTSEREHGTLATLWLPASEAAIAVATKPADRSIRSTPAATIMLADDEPPIAMSAVDMRQTAKRVIE